MMKKIMKIGIVSIFLVPVLVYSPAVGTVNASEISLNYSENSFVREMNDLKPFVSRNSDGTIALDNSAIELGYISNQTIIRAKNHIEQINNLVKNYGAEIDDDLTTTIYFSRTAFRSSGGINKIETSWTGTQKVYIDAEKTEDMINRMEEMEETISESTFLDILGEILPSLGTGLAFGRASNQIHLTNLKQAAEGGNGVILVRQPLPNGLYNIYFVSQ